MAEAGNCSGECGGGLLVEMTAGADVSVSWASRGARAPRGPGAAGRSLTAVADARQAGVVRLREAAEARRRVLGGGGAEQRLVRLLHGGGGHVCGHTRDRKLAKTWLQLACEGKLAVGANS